MIEAVTSSVLSGGARKQAPDTSVSSPPPAEVVSRSSDQDFVSSYIRVDNLQNVAILEYRSETGEVKEQYPNPKQIEAFRQAERLRVERDRVEDAAVADAATKGPEVSSAPVPSQSKAAPAPTTSTPAPTDAGSGVVVSDSSSVVV